MKKFIITFLISAFFTAVFLFGVHKGSQNEEQEYPVPPYTFAMERLRNNTHFPEADEEKEETWVYGIKTEFDVQENEVTDMDKAADKFLQDFKKEGLIADMTKGDHFCYIFGVSRDKSLGKSVTLFKNEEDDSVTIIPSSHFLDESKSHPPELPQRIKDIFGYVDLKTAIYSRTSKRTMLIFPYSSSSGKAIDLISRKMEEMGYVEEKPGENIPIKSNLMYFTREERECFFEVNSIDSSRVSILTAEYPR